MDMYSIYLVRYVTDGALHCRCGTGGDKIESNVIDLPLMGSNKST